MTCEDPGINKTGTYVIQITLDGVTYVTSSVRLVVADCKVPGGGGGGGKVDAGLAVGLLFAIIGLILLILLCCFWIFFPLICCRIVGGLPPEPKEEEPEPVEARPGRKWEVVDASYYGRGGAGGIRPVTVRWGQGGATEEGNKLTKAKDAEVLEVVEQPGVPAQPVTRPPPPGCWDKFKKKVKRMYAVASSYRPVWGPTKKVLWFPGTKPKTSSQPTASHAYKAPATSRPSKPAPVPLRAGSSTAFLLPENGSSSSPVGSPPPYDSSNPRPPPLRPTRAPPRPPSLNRPSRPPRPPANS
ncbi:Anthrax toxin receptor 1 [Geodia barretti]|nr:Anthrax toxin receptor 1 [Geodia barretti]